LSLLDLGGIWIVDYVPLLHLRTERHEESPIRMLQSNGTLNHFSVRRIVLHDQDRLAEAAAGCGRISSPLRDVMQEKRFLCGHQR
jgi:hypothetical protein